MYGLANISYPICCGFDCGANFLADFLADFRKIVINKSKYDRTNYGTGNSNVWAGGGNRCCYLAQTSACKPSAEFCADFRYSLFNGWAKNLPGKNRTNDSFYTA